MRQPPGNPVHLHRVCTIMCTGLCGGSPSSRFTVLPRLPSCAAQASSKPCTLVATDGSVLRVSLQRTNRVVQATEAINLDNHFVTMLEEERRLAKDAHATRCAGHDNVAWLEREQTRTPRDNICWLEDELTGLRTSRLHQSTESAGKGDSRCAV